MRVSLKRVIQWVLVLALIQLGVYYWSVSKTSKKRRTKIKPHKFFDPPTGDNAACTFENCPKVKNGILNVHMVPHSHIDVGWLKTVDQYYTGKNADPIDYFNPKVECVRCTLNTTITELLRNPERRFIFIEMIYLARYWNESTDKQKEVLMKLIKERRFEIINGGWVMSDAGITWYNDIIDQHTLGFDFIRETFGPCAQTRTAWHVDQFGHSREHASIFAQMGYDSLFVGRIDYQDHDDRKLNKNLEFVWETSPNFPESKSKLFTQATYDGYYAPPSFVLDNAVSNMFEGHDGDIDEFARIMQARAKTFKTNHLLVPMGSDFGYSQARLWFDNMDTLIKKINQQQNHWKMNMIYSTPSCYVYNVNKEKATFETKKDDFHPYGISPGVYWTGYFTTRGGFKNHIRLAGQVLQSCKEMSIFMELDGTFDKIQTLRSHMAIMQHHDAITGTQKKHVLKDYNLLLSQGVHECQDVLSSAFQKLWYEGPESAQPAINFCPDLNISSCPVSEGKTQFLVTLYNPLSWITELWVRVPISYNKLTITDKDKKEIPFQLSNIPKAIQSIPERKTVSRIEAVFKVELPPMSSTSFLLKPESDGHRPKLKTSSKDVVLENEYLSLTFKRKTGLLSQMVNKESKIDLPVTQDYVYYEGMQGGMRSSGAYVFIPNSATTNRVSGGKIPILSYFKGDLVQEVHQIFSPWVTQVVRLYKGVKYAEFQWIVGPIPSTDTIGKEVVSLFQTNINNKDLFYTDSNGREMMERRRDFRETWDLKVRDKVSGNYYPVTSRMFIKDPEKNVQLTILPDRPQGGGSIVNGAMEIMVHRYALFDDGLGVGEPLDDKGEDRQGIIFTGKLYVVLERISKSPEVIHPLALQLHLGPTIMFIPAPEGAPLNKALEQHSFLTKPLPANIQVLTLDRISRNETTLFLLRLEHIYEVNEHPVLSKPSTVSLEKMFKSFDIVSVEETSLGGNFHPNEITRLQWITEKGLTNKSIGSNNYSSSMPLPFVVLLEPMEIRTFRIHIERND